MRVPLVSEWFVEKVVEAEDLVGVIESITTTVVSVLCNVVTYEYSLYSERIDSIESNFEKNHFIRISGD